MTWTLMWGNFLKSCRFMIRIMTDLWSHAQWWRPLASLPTFQDLTIPISQRWSHCGSGAHCLSGFSVGVSFRVSEYCFPALHCYQRHQYGHSSATCRSPVRCFMCGVHHCIKGEDGTRDRDPFCYLCLGVHRAVSHTCPIYHLADKINSKGCQNGTPRQDITGNYVLYWPASPVIVQWQLWLATGPTGGFPVSSTR